MFDTSITLPDELSWLPSNIAGPSLGWPRSQYKHVYSMAKNDILGKLYYHLFDTLSDFLTSIGRYPNLSFEIVHCDMAKLDRILRPSVKFDRIMVRLPRPGF